MPCVHVFRSANHQLGLYLRRMFVPRSKNVVSNAEIHDVGGLKSTAKVSLYDHDYGPSYYARCHKIVAQCTVLLYVRHGLELGCSSWSVFSTDGDRREHRFFVLETCGHRRKTPFVPGVPPVHPFSLYFRIDHHYLSFDEPYVESLQSCCTKKSSGS